MSALIAALLSRVVSVSVLYIGGLADNSQSNSTSGIPFLSKIPGLGWLMLEDYGPRTAMRRSCQFFVSKKPNKTMN